MTVFRCIFWCRSTSRSTMFEGEASAPNPPNPHRIQWEKTFFFEINLPQRSTMHVHGYIGKGSKGYIYLLIYQRKVSTNLICRSKGLLVWWIWWGRLSLPGSLYKQQKVPRINHHPERNGPFTNYSCIFTFGETASDLKLRRRCSLFENKTPEKKTTPKSTPQNRYAVY